EEVLSRELRQLRSEGEDAYGIQSLSLQQLHPFLERSEVCYRCPGTQNSARVRVERQSDGRQPLATRALQQHADEVLVAAVHSVENADRYAARPAGRDARQLAPGERDAHQRAALTRARRFASGVLGSIEQPGASRNRRAFVSSIAARASPETPPGGPDV